MSKSDPQQRASKVYWNSIQEKNKVEQRLKYDHGSVSQGIKTIVKSYYAVEDYKKEREGK